MKVKEKISKHLGVPYVYLPDEEKFICENGVAFTLEEYKNGIDLNVEYERRKEEGTLYDYEYAKKHGKLKSVEQTKEEPDTVADTSIDDVPYKLAREVNEEHKSKAVTWILLLLAFTSVVSMYISTLHTATYLYTYVDGFSAWLMSASVTAYNATAFEVSVLFHNTKRNFMAFIFMSLWIMVTLFSMATTVSIFYDQFNFQETQIAQENKAIDSNKLSLELLQKKEKDLREAIEFKKKDIEYRQEKEYATATVRKELNVLQEELQNNLSEQQKLLSDTPEVTKEVLTRKESLFAFLGRLMHLEGGILEFIMSTLSAVFVNLIAPLSLSATMELSKKEIK